MHIFGGEHEDKGGSSSKLPRKYGRYGNKVRFKFHGMDIVLGLKHVLDCVDFQGR